MDDALHIQSITGVDVDLKIAGPGGRSYAFVMDWHIRLLLALTWWLLATLLFAGSLSADVIADAAGNGYLMFAVVPATALFFLYHPVLEVAMQGRTPGKRMAGIRIVTQTGDVPGIGAILVRNVLRLVDSLPGVYAIGLAATIVSNQSVRIGDMAAGTLLVYEEDESQDAFEDINSDAIARIGLENLQLIGELVDRWPDLELQTRVTLGQKLLGRFVDEVPEEDGAIFDRLNQLRLAGV